MSSPNLNNIIILGCILIYASGILIGIDEENVSAKVNAKVCQVGMYCEIPTQYIYIPYIRPRTGGSRG